MNSVPNIGQSMANWVPTTPTKKSEPSTEAMDGKDTMTGTDDLKRFVGNKSGIPKGPFGYKGREF